MAESSGRSTHDSTGTSDDSTAAGARDAAGGTGPAATDDPPTERFAAATDTGQDTGGSAATGAADSTDPATSREAVRPPARSVPGGVGIPGRAAPRRVLGAHETMPGEDAPSREGATSAPAGDTPASDARGADTTTAGPTAARGDDDEQTTTIPAQRGDEPSHDDRSGSGSRAGAGAGAAAGAAGATAWSQTAGRAGSPGADRTTALETSAPGADAPATSRLDTTGPDSTDHDEAVRPGAGQEPHDGAVAVDDRPAEVVAPPVRRGTGDLGLLVLRLVLGADLLGHGLQKLPGLFGGSGIDGYTQLLRDGGYRQPGVLAYVGAISEIGAGALLVLGLLTPLAAAAATGVLVNTWFFREAATPGEFQFFFSQGGAELEIVLLAVAVVVALAGPGRAALDARRRWATRPTWDGVLAVVVGAGAGVAVWFLLNGANPFA